MYVLVIFLQEAYNHSKYEALGLVFNQLQSLFEKRGSSDALDYTSRAYGMLLSATKARSDECTKKAVQKITTKV